jgi:hypothetical protein
MLGIVEATFGGQKGYLNKIVDKELEAKKKSGFNEEIELLKAYREKRK